MSILKVTDIKAKDGTSAGSIADSTGVVTLASSVLTTADINGGTIDGTDITVGSGKTLNVSDGTLTLADNQISGDKIHGGTISNFTSTGITDNLTSGGPALTIDASGNVTLAEKLIIDPTKGIQFRTSTGGSGTFGSGILDDYEEGTWDMVVTYNGSASGVTYNTRTGYYTKVGNFVFVSGVLYLTSKGTGSGNVQISLPFQNHSVRSGLAVGNTQNITVNNSPREFFVEQSVAYFQIRFPSGTGSTTDITYSDIATNLYVAFGGCYRVA